MNWKTHEGRVISQADYDRLNADHQKLFLPALEGEVTHEVGTEYNADTYLTIPIYPLKARENRIEASETKAEKELTVTGSKNDSHERSTVAGDHEGFDIDPLPKIGEHE